MAPRGFINPTPKTESARSALSSFTCTLCNKSYSRHPEYEAHISSYDHQHRKRLQDLKQLSRDPNAAEKARRAEKKADAEAGLRVIDTNKNGTTTGIGGATKAGGSGGGFKKGGFKSSFTAVKGPAAPTKKNVLGDYDDDNDQLEIAETNELVQDRLLNGSSGFQHDNTQSDTDEEYENNGGGGEWYDPRRPTDCSSTCTGARTVKSTPTMV